MLTKGKCIKQHIKWKPLDYLSYIVFFFISKSSLNTSSFMATVVIYLEKVIFNKCMWNYRVDIFLLLRCCY